MQHGIQQNWSLIKICSMASSKIGHQARHPAGHPAKLDIDHDIRQDCTISTKSEDIGHRAHIQKDGTMRKTSSETWMSCSDPLRYRPRYPEKLSIDDGQWISQCVPKQCRRRFVRARVLRLFRPSPSRQPRHPLRPMFREVTRNRNVGSAIPGMSVSTCEYAAPLAAR